MYLYDNELYQQDIAYISGLSICWECLRNATVLISGATGLVGSFLVDVLMHKNRTEQLSCTVLITGRNTEKARSRFSRYWEDKQFHFFCCNLMGDLPCWEGAVDYVIHAASNTHPVAYATDPIGTVTTNIIGTKNLLDFAVEHQTRRVVFLSSVEIYGENRGDTEFFAESYCGYLDCNTLRAGYPESKRAGEALCQAYIRQKNADVVIPRLSRVYGPTLLKDDSKAMSQFIRNALAGEDIVLKSEGTQFFSYSYMADAVSGILFCLMYGQCGEAYNVADPSSNIRLKDLAQTIAASVGKSVIFELPDAVESAGYSKATVAVMDSTKLKKLGWHAEYDIRQGIQRTIAIMKDTR